MGDLFGVAKIFKYFGVLEIPDIYFFFGGGGCYVIKTVKTEEENFIERPCYALTKSPGKNNARN